jgi:hypothetical protein
MPTETFHLAENSLSISQVPNRQSISQVSGCVVSKLLASSALTPFCSAGAGSFRAAYWQGDLRSDPFGRLADKEKSNIVVVFKKLRINEN